MLRYLNTYLPTYCIQDLRLHKSRLEQIRTDKKYLHTYVGMVPIYLEQRNNLNCLLLCSRGKCMPAWSGTSKMSKMARANSFMASILSIAKPRPHRQLALGPWISDEPIPHTSPDVVSGLTLVLWYSYPQQSVDICHHIISLELLSPNSKSNFLFRHQLLLSIQEQVTSTTMLAQQ